ncbi:MAG: hypothetical protein GY845_09625 [Planctomycetes bacterium]|nr:hypothetical protein [Planctomycetota bacterium]
MSGKSTKSQIVCFRVPNEVYEILDRRMNKSRFFSVNEYVQQRIIYDTLSNHGKRKIST